MSENKRKLLGFVVPAAFLLMGTVSAALIHARGDVLKRRGVNAVGTVVGYAFSRDYDYLIVTFKDVRTNTVRKARIAIDADYSKGDAVDIRYDPLHPEVAEAREDRPYPYLPPLGWLGGGLLGLALAAAVTTVAALRRRRSLALLSTTPSQKVRKVRVEVWNRYVGGKRLPYLSVYAGGSLTPMLCMQVTSKEIEALHKSQVFDLFGSGHPGAPVALRDGDLVILPAAKTRDAHWEARRRKPGSEVDLPTAGPTIQPRRDVPSAFADRAEARAWWNLGRTQRWLLLLALLYLPSGFFIDKFAAHIAIIFPLAIAQLAAQARRWQVLGRIGGRIRGETSTDRSSRRAARVDADAFLRSPAGTGQIAALLGKTVDEFTRSESRAQFALKIMAGLVAVTVVVLLVRTVVS